MGLQAGHIVFIGTIGKLCFYKSCGQYCVRKSSSLTGKRVKKDKAFERTMENAGILARASRIGSAVYRALPKTFRQYWMYRAFTGEAIHLLRRRKTDEEARMILWKTYAEIWTNKETPVTVSEVVQTTGAKQKPSITYKNDNSPALYICPEENSIFPQPPTSNLQHRTYSVSVSPKRMKRRRRTTRHIAA
jgi:hypothetical protein